MLGFNDTSTLVGHFVSSPREREKRDRRDSRGDVREGQGRKRNRNQSEETEEITRGPWAKLAHLIDIAIADIQMLCNIFPILSLQLMKGSSLYPRHTKYAMGVYSFCLFCVSVCQSVSQSVNIYFVSKISQELLYLET